MLTATTASDSRTGAFGNPISLDTKKMKRFLEHGIKLEPSSNQIIQVQEVVKSILKGFHGAEEKGKLCLGGSFLTWLLTEEGFYDDIDLKLSSEGGFLALNRIETVVAKALKSLSDNSAYTMKSSQPLGLQNGNLLISSFSLQASKEGNAPLGISISAFGDLSKGTKYLFNIDSFYIDFKLREDGSLGSSGPDEDGYWVYSHEGEAKEVLKKVRAGVIESAVADQGGTFAWFRLIRNITVRGVRASQREINGILYNQEIKRKIPDFLRIKSLGPGDLFYLSNAIFHLPLDSADLDSTFSGFEAEFRLRLQGAKVHTLSPICSLIRDVNEGEVPSLLKLLLPLLSDRVSKKMHLESEHLQCEFVLQEKTYTVFIPPFSNEDQEILLKHASLISSHLSVSMLLERASQFPLDFIEQLPIASSEAALFFVQLAQKIISLSSDPIERSGVACGFVKELLTRYKGRLGDLPRNLWPEIKALAFSELSERGCNKRVWKQVFQGIVSDETSEPTPPIRSFLQMLADKLYPDDFLKGVSPEQVRSFQRWFHSTEPRLSFTQKLSNLVQNGKVEKALKVLHYRKNTIDFLALQSDIQRWLKKTPSIYTAFLQGVLEREEDVDRKCDMVLRAYEAFCLDDGISEFLEKEYLLKEEQGSGFQKILQKNEETKRSFLEAHSYRVGKLSKDQKTLLAYNLSKGGAKLIPGKKFTFSEAESLLVPGSTQEKRMKLIRKTIEDFPCEEILKGIKSSPFRIDWVTGFSEKQDLSLLARKACLAFTLQHMPEFVSSTQVLRPFIERVEDVDRLNLMLACSKMKNPELDEAKKEIVRLSVSKMSDLEASLSGCDWDISTVDHFWSFLKRLGLHSPESARGLLERVSQLPHGIERCRIEWRMFPFLALESKRRYLAEGVQRGGDLSFLFYLIHKDVCSDLCEDFQDLERTAFSHFIPNLKQLDKGSPFTAQEVEQLWGRANDYFAHRATDPQKQGLILETLQIPRYSKSLQTVFMICFKWVKGSQLVMTYEQVEKSIGMIKEDKDLLKRYIEDLLENDERYPVSILKWMVPYVTGERRDALIRNTQEKGTDLLYSSDGDEIGEFLVYLKEIGDSTPLSAGLYFIFLDLAYTYMSCLESPEQIKKSAIESILRNQTAPEMSPEQTARVKDLSLLCLPKKENLRKMILECSIPLLKQLSRNTIGKSPEDKVAFIDNLRKRFEDTFEIQVLELLESQILGLEGVEYNNIRKRLENLGEDFIRWNEIFSNIFRVQSLIHGVLLIVKKISIHCEVKIRELSVEKEPSEPRALSYCFDNNFFIHLYRYMSGLELTSSPFKEDLTRVIREIPGGSELDKDYLCALKDLAADLAGFLLWKKSPAGFFDGLIAWKERFSKISFKDEQSPLIKGLQEDLQKFYADILEMRSSIAEKKISILEKESFFYPNHGNRLALCAKALRKVLVYEKKSDPETLSFKLLKKIHDERASRKEALEHSYRIYSEAGLIEGTFSGIDVTQDLQACIEFLTEKMKGGKSLAQCMGETTIGVKHPNLCFLANIYRERLFQELRGLFDEKDLAGNMKILRMRNPSTLPEESKLSGEEVLKFLFLQYKNKVSEKIPNKAPKETIINESFHSLNRIDPNTLPFSGLFKEFLVILRMVKEDISLEPSDSALLEIRLRTYILKRCQEEITAAVRPDNPEREKLWRRLQNLIPYIGAFTTIVNYTTEQKNYLDLVGLSFNLADFKALLESIVPGVTTPIHIMRT